MPNSRREELNERLKEGRRRLAPKVMPPTSIYLSIPDIIHGSYKEGFEIRWEIERDDYDKLIVTIESASIPPFWRDAAPAFIEDEMKKQHPEVIIRYI